MSRRALQDRFSGPYCPKCSDDPSKRADLGCACDEARCAMPKCHSLVTYANFPPVPAGLLLWRMGKARFRQGMVPSPGWVCGPACLFGLIRARVGGDSSAEQALAAASELSRLQAIYMGVGPTSRERGLWMDPRVWDLAAVNQVDTIRQAIRYANMAAVP